MVMNTALNSMVDSGRPSAASETSLADVLRPVEVDVPAVPLTTANVIAIRAAQLIVSVAIMTGLIATIYTVLPDVDIHWRDVLVGAIFTAVLLFIGQFLVGLYLSRTNVGSVFGAAGSLTVLLVWIYYSAQILLFGAEFTEVWARHHGAYIRPDADAMWENEDKARLEASKAGRKWAEIDPPP
jgi:uncharacterized BrkB/YihY/UPF0761 family membrane protein